MRNLCHPGQGPGIHGYFSACIENMKAFAVYILCNKRNGLTLINPRFGNSGSRVLARDDKNRVQDS
jgi:hypothetical protein